MSPFDNDASNDINADLPQVDELTSLKARADFMGLKYHPTVGIEKLREKINAALTSAGPVVEEAEVAQPVEETLSQRRGRKKREANELVRIRVTCMNPAKKDWDGEIFTCGNSLVGSFTKFVPFNVEDGWHVPRIIFNQMKERQAQIFVTVKDARGNSTRKGKLIKEFAIEVMPALTSAELHELAQRQAMAKSID
jgi:hypothetical protein